jgi:hypothetical protein
MDGPWGWHVVTGEDLRLVADFMAQMESLSWTEIRTQMTGGEKRRGSKHKFIPIESLTKVAQDRLIEQGSTTIQRVGFGFASGIWSGCGAHPGRSSSNFFLSIRRATRPMLVGDPQTETKAIGLGKRGDHDARCLAAYASSARTLSAKSTASRKDGPLKPRDDGTLAAKAADGVHGVTLIWLGDCAGVYARGT